MKFFTIDLPAGGIHISPVSGRKPWILEGTKKMNKSTKLLLASLALAAVTASTAASAHQNGKAGGTMSGQGMMGSGSSQGGMMHQGQGRSAMPMQRDQGHRADRHRMMHPGAMHGGGSGGHGMMGSGHEGKGRHMGGAMIGGRLRVTPVQHLSIDDVSHFFGHYLERLGNERLKLGEVTKKDEDTITAQVVTLEGSLVQTYEVDRHSGVVK